MADSPIKQKIILEGEKEYKQALKDAQRELKTLRSELKAETAELGKNATEQEKNAVKAKNLQKQIAEQEKIVKTYTEALEEVKKKYGDNEEEVAKWEVKLNEARTALANMKNGLDDAGGSMKRTEADINTGITATKNLSDSFEKLGEVGGNISSAIEDAFMSMVGTIQEAVGQIWGQLMEIAAKSDNYLDLATYFGASATEVQKWDSAMKSAGGSMDTVTQLITKLKYSGKDVQVAKWFAMDPNQYDNDLEFFENLMQRMSNQREEMKKAGTWDEAMKDIFGSKKGFDVEGVLSDWDEILKGLNRFDADKGGFGLSEEQITDMAELNVQVQTLLESWEKLKEMGTVQLFGQLAMDLTGNAQGIVDALKKYFDADSPEERDQALEELKKNIEDAFQRIADAIREGIKILDEVAKELQESEDPIVRTLGNILGGITDALEWLTEDNMNNAIKALEVLAAFWITGNGLKMASTIAGIVANIAVIRGFNAAGGAAGAAGGAAEAAGAAGGAEGAAAGGGLFGALSGKVSAFMASGAAGVAGLAAALAAGGYIGASMINANLNDENLNAIYGDGESGGVIRDADESIAKAAAKYWGIYNDESKTGTEEAFQAREDLYKTLEEHGYVNAEQGVSLFENVFDNWMKENDIDGLAEELNTALQEGGFSGLELPADWWKKGPDENGVTSEDIQNLNALPAEVKDAVESLIGSIKINMNGEKVADLVTPRVSENIAFMLEQ